MKIKLTDDAPHWLPALSLTVQPGETVDAPDDVAASLLAQPVWGRAKPAKESET